jgi:hypothetical protein
MKRFSFIGGFVTAILVLAMCTTALAASGKVTFGFANVALNGETRITSGSTITVANGQKVPGSILYIDEAGGKTNYLPIRAISDLLGVKIDYDSATKTVHLSTKHWQREIEGKTVSYVCGEENNIYDEPPVWRPEWADDGWSLVELHHDTRNYTASWTYQNGDQEVTFKCANPSTAGLGRQMSSAAVASDGQKIVIQGETADYYQDGKHSLLAWENTDGVLNFLTGKNVSQNLLVKIAESVDECRVKLPEQNLGWLPNGYALMEHYSVADAVMEYWVREGVALSWTYSAEPLGLPEGNSIAVEMNGFDAKYWEAEEPYTYDEREVNVDGMPVESVGGVTSVTIPSPKNMNTLAWTDPETGIYYRLQSVLQKTTMINIAENIC